MKTVGTFTQGIAAYDAGKYTRKVMGINSRNTLNAGTAEQEQIRRNARLAMGQQLVGQADSGFQVGTGSALDALRESSINRELDLALSRSNAQGKSAQFLQQGQIAYAQGKAAMSGAILSGAEQIAEQVAGAGGGASDGGGSSATSSYGDPGGVGSLYNFDMSSYGG